MACENTIDTKYLAAYTRIYSNFDILSLHIKDYIELVYKECDKGSNLQLSLELLSAWYVNFKYVCFRAKPKWKYNMIIELNNAKSALLIHIDGIKHLITPELRKECEDAHNRLLRL